MAIEITSYTESLAPLVKAFNQRLKKGGVSYQFPEDPVPTWLPKVEGRKLYQEFFVAVENGTDVRGGFGLKHQEFSLLGENVSIGFSQLPLSEGIVNKAYTSTGVQVLMSLLERSPLLFALGIGGYQEPVARILVRLGWTLETVPFFFRVQHPFRFLRNITVFRSTKIYRVLADLLAFSGIGWLAIMLGNVLLPKRSTNDALLQTKVVEDFEDWVDELWDACRRDYTLCAVRDAATLNVLYPHTESRFIRLKVSREGKIIGWAVLLNTQMKSSKYFGGMRVGSVVDCMARRKDAGQVIRAAAQHLKSLGVDIIVSNQLDAAWGGALKNCGFLRGPSNFLFGASKGLVQRLQPLSARLSSIHMTRGDGDGPINL